MFNEDEGNPEFKLTVTGIIPYVGPAQRDDVPRFLTVFNRLDHKWGLPGGKLDFDETAYETLRRTCREDLGVPDIRIHGLCGIYKFTSRKGNKVCSFALHAELLSEPDITRPEIIGFEDYSLEDMKRKESEDRFRIGHRDIVERFNPEDVVGKVIIRKLG
jgi:ADP-ribose pyrophosphatase YjhB (NUDIX family)